MSVKSLAAVGGFIWTIFEFIHKPAWGFVKETVSTPASKYTELLNDTVFTSPTGKLQFSISSVSTTTSSPIPSPLSSQAKKTRSNMSRLIIMYLLNLEHAPTPKSEVIYLLKESISPWQKIVRRPDAKTCQTVDIYRSCVFVFTTERFDLNAVCVCIYRIASHGNWTVLCLSLFLLNLPSEIPHASTRGKTISTGEVLERSFCWMDAVSGAWTWIFTLLWTLVLAALSSF